MTTIRKIIEAEMRCGRASTFAQRLEDRIADYIQAVTVQALMRTDDPRKSESLTNLCVNLIETTENVIPIPAWNGPEDAA